MDVPEKLDHERTATFENHMSMPERQVCCRVLTFRFYHVQSESRRLFSL
jgi:hypothetical protein